MKKAWAWLGDRPRVAVGLAMALSVLAVWAPFAATGRMDTVGRHFDGPAYMYVAKTLYQVPEDHPFVGYNLPRAYFSTPLPGFPILIRALLPVALGSYPVATLLATLLSAVASAVLFYELLARWELVSAPLWTAILFCFFPPRWVIYHSVGASEPLYLCFVFAAFLALRADRTGWVVGFTLLASLTRVTGVLMVPAFGLLYLERRQSRRALAMPLALSGILGLFGYYRVVFSDFLAYFHWSLDEVGLVSLRPFEILRRYASAGKFHDVELYAWMYALVAVGTALLWKRRELFWYAAVHAVFCAFLTAQDLPRYLLMLMPFAILIGLDPVLGRREARFTLPVLAYVAYEYAWRILPRKMVPVGVWEDLLTALAGP